MSRWELAVLPGGRAAESVVFGDISTGAADDLARATDMARSMVVRLGMTPELGQVAYGHRVVAQPAAHIWLLLASVWRRSRRTAPAGSGHYKISEPMLRLI